MPNVSLEKADHIVARGRVAARDRGLNAVFAILDTGANLVTFSRMDSAWLASNELSIAKARTSVMFQMPSEALSVPWEPGQPLRHFDHIHSGGLLLMAGALLHNSSSAVR
ncbi:GlcG/HbpS family heme-binding protein [Comamonas sp. 4034]|uniref:GlcG/HbpS family heme-binding protein n=1 Tax=Comamonas sp. 4034 TaxID=3156455 RepID=UPI000FBB7BB7